MPPTDDDGVGVRFDAAAVVVVGWYPAMSAVNQRIYGARVLKTTTMQNNDLTETNAALLLAGRAHGGVLAGDGRTNGSFDGTNTCAGGTVLVCWCFDGDDDHAACLPATVESEWTFIEEAWKISYGWAD